MKKVSLFLFKILKLIENLFFKQFELHFPGWITGQGVNI